QHLPDLDPVSAAADDTTDTVRSGKIGFPAPALTDRVRPEYSVFSTVAVTPQVLPVQQVHLPGFAGGDGELGRRPRLARQQENAAGAEIEVELIELFHAVDGVGRSEEVFYRRQVGRQFDNALRKVGHGVVSLAARVAIPVDEKEGFPRGCRDAVS